MTLAICVRCGADKFGSLTSCPNVASNQTHNESRLTALLSQTTTSLRPCCVKSGIVLPRPDVFHLCLQIS